MLPSLRDYSFGTVVILADVKERRTTSTVIRRPDCQCDKKMDGVDCLY